MTPTLIQVGAKDEMSPQEPINTFVRRTGPVVTASSYDCGHFGMLRGQLRRRAIARQLPILTGFCERGRYSKAMDG